METKKVFRPVYGLDADILGKEYKDGYIYFATDSGRIYLDTTENGMAKNKVAMGGSGASLFYAYDETVVKKPGDIHILTISTIDGSDAIKEDDLIINQANGCFYKVDKIFIDTDELECSLIAVSGTGGGGSGGGGGSSDEETNLVATVSGIATRSTFVYEQQAFIDVNIKAEYDAYANVVFEIIGRTASKVVVKEDIPANGVNQSLDIGSLLYEGLNDVIIRIETNNSGNMTYRYTNCQAVRMSLTGSTDINPAKIFAGDTTLNVIPIGQGLTKYITLKIDGIEIPESAKTVTQSGSAEGIRLPMQEHGAHTVEIGMYVSMNGQKIFVPSLVYEFAWKEANKKNAIIWLGNYRKNITDYEVNSVEYMVYDPEISEGVEFSIDLIKETVAVPRTIAYSSEKMLVWNISDYSIGRNNYAISYKGQSKNIVFDVAEDTSRPNMIINPTGLYLNLDSQGRSNGEPTYTRNVWEYKNSNNTILKTTFNNFNWYNNGWIEDTNGISALRIANGSSINIQTTGVMQEDRLASGWTFEFRFKVRNVQSYRTLVNVTGTADDEQTSSEVIANFTDYSFAQLYGGSVGLGLGPSDIFFKGGGKVASVRYKEDEMINASIVIDNYGDANKIIYIYINGIMSKVIKCDQNNGFKIDSLGLEFNSNVCDVDLYNVRIYNRALNFSEVIQNYVVDEKNITLYDVNNITTTTAEGINTIDLVNLTTYNNDHKENPTMPYAILKVNDSNVTHDLLPYKKGNKIKCDVTFINVPLDMAYETNTLTTSSGMDIKEFYKHSCPSFRVTQAEVDVQGTSSQGYPRRNYKLKFSKGKNWVMHQGPYKENPEALSEIYLDNSRGEPTVTWKADYMESSSTHNTGFTSYVKTLYTKHPLQDYYENNTIDNLEDLRTTIYGFPMMLFQEHKDGTFEFIGKYNFNYDKDCPNVIGFTYPEQHPILTDKKMSEVAECWELCNNKGTRCSFTKVDFDEVTDAEKEDLTLTVLDDFEYRYLDKDKADFLDDYADKKITINETANIQVLEHYKNLEDICTWLYNLNTSDAALEGFENKELEKQNRLNKFEREFRERFDMEYCLVYFILTELLVQYDSRGKNMMLATWGPQTAGGNYIWYPIFYDVDTQLGINNSGVPLWDYDVNPSDDNVFSTANSVLWNNFYKCFLTEIKAKYAALRGGKGGIGGILDFQHLNGYYDFNPNISGSYAMKGLRPEAVYNADSYFKYIAPARSGYIDTEGALQKTDAYYYCAQGTRELQRELFLNNRFYYLDSKWQGGSFDGTSKSAMAQTRINANVIEDTSDKFYANEDYPNDYDVPDKMTITPYLNSYVGVYTDDTASLSENMTKAGIENEVVFQADFANEIRNTPNKTQQLIYICGKEYLSDFGDLSKYYLDEMDLQGAIRLKNLKLGSDLPDYYNNFFSPEKKIVFDKVNGYPLLQSLNFSKLNKFNGNLSFLNKSEKLKELRALGSSITGVQLADGAQIEVCHLPKTITDLTLIETNNLTSLLQDRNALQQEVNGETEWIKGLYIEGLTNYLYSEQIEAANIEDLATQLTKIKIIGNSLGINSYRLLNSLVKIKEKIYTSNSKDYPKDLSIHMTNINWSPYIQIESGANRDVDIPYYLKQDNYTFKSYTYISEAQWNLDTLNGKVYKLNNDFNTSYITDLSLLDILIDNEGDRYHDSTTFNKTIPYLSGVLYVDGKVDEALIRNKYNVAFPALEIQAKEVKPAYTIKYVEIKDNGEEYLWEVQKYENKSYTTEDMVQALQNQPTKTHYDFLGWSLNSSDVTPAEKQPTEYNLLDIIEMADNNTVTFYTVYKKHEYKLMFYNYDGSVLDGGDDETVGQIFVEYEKNLQTPDIIPYADDGKLATEYTYSFIGYTEYGESDNPTNTLGLQSLEEIQAQMSLKDRKFYARYEQKSVYDNIHPEYFTSFNSDYIENNDYDIYGGVTLVLNKVIKGKLTIPKEHNGKPVLILNNSFSSSNNGNQLSHIFFEPGTQIKQFAVANDIGTFQNNANLKYIEIPDSLRHIGNNCFRGCTNLELANNYLGKNLAYIGSYAFTGALKKNSLAGADTILTISDSVEELEYYSFGNPNSSIYLLEIGSEEKPANLLKLDKTSATNGGTFIFSSSGTNFMNIILYTDNYSEEDLAAYYKGEKTTLQVKGAKEA